MPFSSLHTFLSPFSVKIYSKPLQQKGEIRQTGKGGFVNTALGLGFGVYALGLRGLGFRGLGLDLRGLGI